MNVFEGPSYKLPCLHQKLVTSTFSANFTFGFPIAQVYADVKGLVTNYMEEGLHNGRVGGGGVLPLQKGGGGQKKF